MTDKIAEVAILTPFPSTDIVGGTEIFSHQLRAALGGARVFAAPRSEGDTPPWLRKLGLALPDHARRVARAFAGDPDRKRFDLVVCNGLCGWPLAMADPGIPVIQVYHLTLAGLARHALAGRGDRLTTRAVGGFFERLAARNEHVVSVSERVAREVSEYYGAPSRVVPNGVDIERFRGVGRREAREALGLPAAGPVGIFVGRPEYAKGFDVLLQVVRAMRDVEFLLVSRWSGSEPNARAYRDVPHERMPLLYSAADFCLLPSRYEGFHLSVLEAAACDVPVVVSSAGYTFPEDPGEVGRVVPTLAPEAYVAAVREVLSSPTAFSPRAALAERYSLEAFRARWRALVASIVGTGTRHA